MQNIRVKKCFVVVKSRTILHANKLSALIQQ